MKYILLALSLVSCAAAASAQPDQEAAVTAAANEKLGDLASLAEGLAVAHTPDPVRYVLHTPSISGVQWVHSTTVSALAGPVTIVEFGYFVERNGQWELPYEGEVPIRYTAGDFAERFACPQAALQPGRSYTNPRTQSVIDCVPEQRVKWYYIGLDGDGKRVKGEATVTLQAELDPSEYGPRK